MPKLEKDLFLYRLFDIFPEPKKLTKNNLKRKQSYMIKVMGEVGLQNKYCFPVCATCFEKLFQTN